MKISPLCLLNSIISPREASSAFFRTVKWTRTAIPAFGYNPTRNMVNTVMEDQFREKIIQQIRLHYGFQHVQWVGRLGGLSGQNDEIVIDSVPFVLKKYRSKNKDDIARIEKITQFLYSHSLPVMPALISYEKKAHFAFQGNFFALFPKIPGQVLHEPSLSEDALSCVASLLAQMHKLDASSLKLPDFQSRILPLQAIQSAAHATLSTIQTKTLGSTTDQLVSRLIRAKLETLTDYLPSNFAHQYLRCRDFVHGDFHNENIIFNELFKIVRLLDFEETHFGHRIEDVLHFILLACCNTGFQASNLNKARFFIQAYQALFPLTHEEVMFGIRHALYKDCSSFFIEEALYRTEDLFFAKLIERDLAKILYLRQHMNVFMNHLFS